MIAVTYAKKYPECSIVLDIPGSQLYDSCGPIIGNRWFWPILMTCGIVAMTAGGVFGFHVVHSVFFEFLIIYRYIIRHYNILI